jgi:uridine kinase
MKLSRLTIWLLSRLAFGIFFIPFIQTSLFLPFLVAGSSHVIDPWSYWLTIQGRVEAFPYGPIMFICFLPAALIGQLFSSLFNLDQLNQTQILLVLSLLLVDFSVVRILGGFSENRQRFWSWSVLLAPLSIYITFIHGQLDVIPACFLLYSVVQIIDRKWSRAGLFLGLGISAKFSLILVLPFILLFIATGSFTKKNTRDFLIWLTFAGSFTLLPAIYSNGYLTMVLGTPEVLKTLDARLNIGISSLFLVPVVYLLLFLSFWNLGRISNTVLISYIGATLLFIACIQTSSIGWFHWGFPLVLLVLKNASDRTFILLATWQVSVCLYYFTGSKEIEGRFISSNWLHSTISADLRSLMFTMNLITGTIIVLKVLEESKKFGDIYRISLKPLSLAIAGDSGVGKGTLSREIANAFGEQQVSILLGDDYHLHERDDSSWLNTTHLNPEANDLQEMGRHFSNLLSRERILVKHYDHKLGRFTLPRKISPAHFIVLDGLHAHQFPGSEKIDVRVFLSMEEELRIRFKINRDIEQRGHADENVIRESIARRKLDYEKFVKPQQAESDIFFHLSLISNEPLRLSLMTKTADIVFLNEIYRAISAITTCPTLLERRDDESYLKVDATEFSGEDAQLILQKFMEKPDQFFVSNPEFSEGVTGLMALISILVLAKKRS